MVGPPIQQWLLCSKRTPHPSPRLHGGVSTLNLLPPKKGIASINTKVLSKGKCTHTRFCKGDISTRIASAISGVFYTTALEHQSIERERNTMPVSTQAQKNVQTSLDSVTSNAKETGVAGMVFIAVDKNGDHIVANASGNRGLNTKKPMDLDTVFWIASCTKLLATIACMQLVEQGKLKLDDHEHLYKLCPELAKVQVLQDDHTLKPKEKEITLRMLLTHTAGFGYEFFNAKLRDYGRPIGFDVFQAKHRDIYNMPLVNQPGSTWEYGVRLLPPSCSPMYVALTIDQINIDWAGIALERASGMTLDDYMQAHIFAPLDLHNISMFPSSSMKSNLASMHQRWPGSTASEERDHVYLAPLSVDTAEEKKAVLCSGGAGCFAKPIEYVQVLATLLNDGTSPKTGKKILEKKTVEEMFENQIPQFPDFARGGIEPAKKEHGNPAPEFYPQEGNPPQGMCPPLFLYSPMVHSLMLGSFGQLNHCAIVC